MPVRSLSSSVLRWPDARTVERAFRQWAEEVVRNRKDVLRIGYWGSYARGDWGVGSDLDVIVIVRSSSQPFEKRAVEWDTAHLPVPVDLLVYTEEEWRSLIRQRRLGGALMREAVWVGGE